MENGLQVMFASVVQFLPVLMMPMHCLLLVSLPGPLWWRPPTYKSHHNWQKWTSVINKHNQMLLHLPLHAIILGYNLHWLIWSLACQWSGMWLWNQECGFSSTTSCHELWIDHGQTKNPQLGPNSRDFRRGFLSIHESPLKYSWAA